MIIQFLIYIFFFLNKLLLFENKKKNCHCNLFSFSFDYLFISLNEKKKKIHIKLAFKFVTDLRLIMIFKGKLINIANYKYIIINILKY